MNVAAALIDLFIYFNKLGVLKIEERSKNLLSLIFVINKKKLNKLIYFYDKKWLWLIMRLLNFFFSLNSILKLIHSIRLFSMPYTETFEIGLYHHLSFLMATTKCNIFLLLHNTVRSFLLTHKVIAKRREKAQFVLRINLS